MQFEIHITNVEIDCACDLKNQVYRGKLPFLREKDSMPIYLSETSNNSAVINEGIGATPN